MNQAARLPALTDFLAGNFVQALAVQRCCKPRDRLLEAWIACRQMLRRMNPCQIDPQGLGLEFPRKSLWQRIRRRPVEIARLLVPGDVAAGEGDEDVLYRFAFESETDFASDPLGTSGTRRGEQNEISCTFERAADRSGQIVGGNQAGLIAKDSDRAQLPPRLGKSVQCRLQRRRQVSIGCMAVADEGVVTHSIRPHTSTESRS